MTAIIGRDAERARLEKLVATTRAGDGTELRSVVLVGDPGSGKSTLLDLATTLGRDAGLRVLAARGTPHEHDVAHACLHRLLRPVLPAAAGLPPRQRAAVEAAFGLGDDGEPPDPLLLALGALTLLSDVADPAGLLVVVDDLHWADTASARVLELVAARLEGEHISMLLGTRPGEHLPDDHAREVETVTLGPLDAASAEALLDVQPDAPQGMVRRRLLDVAEGNPLALVELVRAGTTPGTTVALGDHVPLTARLEQAFAARTEALGPATRRLLLLAAAAGEEDLAALLTDTAATAHGLSLDDWAPAERAGLVHVATGGVRFRHPLVRSAVYAAAPVAERRRAHEQLADMLHDDPERRVWHLSSATVGTDETVAAALERSAERVRGRGGWVTAALWLERAAELSPERRESARRLLLAAQCAMYGGQGWWVVSLAQRAAAQIENPIQAAEATYLRGWALSQSPRHADAVHLLTGGADDAARAGATGIAVAALAPAAVSAYFSGDPDLTARVGASLARLGPTTAPHAVWVASAIDPLGTSVRTAAELDTRLSAAGGVEQLDHVTLNVLGGAAWIVDETPLAIQLMRTFLDRLERPATAGVNALVSNTLAAALIEAGLWDESWSVLESTVRVASETGMEAVRHAAVAALAMLTALRGDPVEARSLAARALAGVDPERSRAVAVRARWALGLAAAAEGDWERSHHVLRLLLDDGAPAHPHLALYALPDLVTSALRTGRHEAAAAAAAVLGERAAAGGSARLRVLAAHARALVTTDDDAAEAWFVAALGEERGTDWPVERARARADYGAWLRRRRRVIEAREQLTESAETFARVGARPLIEHVARELRAAGVRPGSVGVAGDLVIGGEQPVEMLADLTPQQRQIVLLAARGLTNREIGEQLFLSPRTVGFHLYQVFPRLGITSRTQLRDVVERTHVTAARPVT